MNLRTLLLLLITSLLINGCGQGGPTVVPVRGVLLDGGTAVEGAMVELTPANGRPSHGITGKDGRFTLRYSPNRLGALPGEHRVRVTVGMAAYEAALEPGEAPKPDAPKLEAYVLAEPVGINKKSSDLRLNLKEMTKSQ